MARYTAVVMVPVALTVNASSVEAAEPMIKRSMRSIYGNKIVQIRSQRGAPYVSQVIHPRIHYIGDVVDVRAHSRNI